MKDASRIKSVPGRWDLAEAVIFARDCQAIAEQYGAHIGITGGVLFNGTSDKDLDILVYPHDSDNGYDQTVIFSKLKEDIGIEDPFCCHNSPEYERDSKEVTCHKFRGKRVDFFWLRQ